MASLARFLLAAFTCLFLAAPRSLRAQEGPSGEQITQVALLADTTAVEAGKPFHLGFHFKILDKWHMYWRFPGSAGYPLTITEWQLPPGWKAEPIGFPLPVQASDTYGQTFFAYEHEVMFPVKITPPEKLTGGPFQLGAKVKWQVCEQTCIPGNTEVSISLPGGAAQPANAALFQTWLSELPQTTEPPTQDVKFDFSGKQLTVRIGGLPADAGVEFFPIPPGTFRGIFEIEKKLVIQTQPDGVRVATYPFDADAGWSGLLVVKGADGKRKGWYIGDPPEVQVERPMETESELVADADGDTWDPFDDIQKAESAQAQKSGGLWVLLLNGFLGGLLLNLMPCVLPVISLKIFGFVRQAGEAKDRIFKLGLAFCAGVFAFFLALAILVLVAAKFFDTSVGWGSQFSNPVILTITIAVMFLFGLSLLGVFEITLGGGTSSKLSELSSKEGGGGAFVHGFFTTLLGTSCTAPLVAPVLGAAINQPGPIIFALFASVATGLSLPYFLLTWQPAWMRFLPKPGTWMIRFKQILGFVMLAFTVWLMGSYGNAGVVVTVAYFLITLAIGAWLVGSYHESRWPLVAAIALAAFGWWAFIHGNIQRPEAKSSGLVSTVRKGLKEGRPVFVDFTADWCLNCKTFEKLVIDTEPIQTAFKAKNVLFVKADFTAQPPDIAEALKKMGRVGVPAYVLFRKRGDYWLADGLTTGALLEELNKIP